MLAYAATLTVT